MNYDLSMNANQLWHSFKTNLQSLQKLTLSHLSSKKISAWLILCIRREQAFENSELFINNQAYLEAILTCGETGRRFQSFLIYRSGQ